MNRPLTRLACVLIAGMPVLAAANDVLPPVSRRFAQDEPAEVPHFQRHVIPLLGRLGCNSRACHGSFQGQGGFRLSLFGYDFEADLAALTLGQEPRINRDTPADSLILQKPTLGLDHEGGERFRLGGWEYRLLERWIASGAAGRAKEDPALAGLEVEPREIVFSAARETVPLRLIARWSDGTREDVTPLCRFRTNDESIATVSDAGLVTAVGKGDTHVVAFYDNGIVPVPVMLPVSERLGEKFPHMPAPTEIDRLVLAKLRTLGVVPSEVCSDAEFLRRASLDLTGTLPTPSEVRAFLADTSDDKRARKIDELLARPGYAAWLTTRLCDLTGNSERNLPEGGEQGVRREKSMQWYDWIYRRVDENVPYDQLIEGIVMAVSRRPGQTDEEYFAEMTAYFREKERGDFSRQPWMPYFWTSSRFAPPQTLRFSYAFLGVRLECAECHKHPYDQWTQADYQDFQAFFSEVRFRQSASRGSAQELKQSLGLTADPDSGQYKRLFAELARRGTIVPWGEVTAPNWQSRKRPGRPSAKNPTGRVITPRLLGGEEVLAENYSDPREPVMQWLREPDNPYFARAIVNRIWAACFGVGIIDPPDDMNLANPPFNEPLLDYLAGEFVTHGYDLKWLHRTIALSRTYQLSWKPNETNAVDERNFSRALVRRLPAEVACDAVAFATAAAQSQQKLQNEATAVRERQIGFPDASRNAAAVYALRLFGKPAREQVCDCERSSEPSLLQTIYLRNDADVLAALDRPDSWLRELSSRDAAWLEAHRDELIQEAWLRTFSRFPREDELTVGRQRLSAGDGILAGLRDLLWALLNSKEFILNH